MFCHNSARVELPSLNKKKSGVSKLQPTTLHNQKIFHDSVQISMQNICSLFPKKNVVFSFSCLLEIALRGEFEVLSLQVSA